MRKMLIGALTSALRSCILAQRVKTTQAAAHSGFESELINESLRSGGLAVATEVVMRSASQRLKVLQHDWFPGGGSRLEIVLEGQDPGLGKHVLEEARHQRRIIVFVHLVVLIWVAVFSVCLPMVCSEPRLTPAAVPPAAVPPAVVAHAPVVEAPVVPSAPGGQQPGVAVMPPAYADVIRPGDVLRAVTPPSRPRTTTSEQQSNLFALPPNATVPKAPTNDSLDAIRVAIGKL